jgi:putative DNA primase/helicase
MSASFAGPLLVIGAEPSGGIHLMGKSRSGKSSALFMAGSIWGRSDAKVRTWRATSNGLEGVAEATSDSCLFLDEIGQAEGREAGKSIYMLANGMGKQRATTTGAAREVSTWNLIFLSSGEISLDAKMAEEHRTAATGLQIRLVNLDADVGAGMGVFQTLHDKATPAELADHLRTASRTYYGIAAREFLELLTMLRNEDIETLRAMIATFREEFKKTYVPADADGQVISVAGRFSLIGAAGELAAALDVVPWKYGVANEAAGACFRDWLQARGHAGAGEDELTLAVMRRFIVANGQSRFSEFGNTDDLIRDRVGWRKNTSEGGEDYLFHSDVWGSVFNGTNINPVRAAQVLDRSGLLLKKEKGRLTARLTIGAHNRPRVYWVSGHILSDE